MAGGVERFEYFKNVVAVPDARKTTLAWSFAAFGRSELWVALITFLYLDFLDATGTLFSMGESLGAAVAACMRHRGLWCAVVSMHCVVHVWSCWCDSQAVKVESRDNIIIYDRNVCGTVLNGAGLLLCSGDVC